MIRALLLLVIALASLLASGCTNYSPTDSQLDKILGTITSIVTLVLVPLVGWWINRGSKARSEDVKRAVSEKMEAQASHVVAQTQCAVQEAAESAARSAVVGARVDDRRRDRRSTDKPTGDG